VADQDEEADVLAGLADLEGDAAAGGRGAVEEWGEIYDGDFVGHSGILAAWAEQSNRALGFARVSY
jgi:hypothetical protein